MLSPAFEVPGLHRMVYREHPVEVDAVDRSRMHDPAYKAKRAEAARFNFNWLSATGTAILLAALATALFLRIPPQLVARTAGATLARMRWPLLTIAFMLSLGFVTRFGGTDATLGLAFTKTGWFYPFFAAMLGWLGVALTGSDTSSNVLFGSLQKITAQQLGLDPILITTANSTGGVMGKMIDAQSIVVATAATNQHGQEGADPAVRLLAQRRARGDHGDHRDAAGVRVSVDGAGSLRHDGGDGGHGEVLTAEERRKRRRAERTSLLEGISAGRTAPSPSLSPTLCELGGLCGERLSRPRLRQLLRILRHRRRLEADDEVLA